ncbi:MAG TPA: hypothetical protein VFL42_06165 [Terriglobales bacterium]|nr:hypothetical protein [Terriglobales bacterium]
MTQPPKQMVEPAEASRRSLALLSFSKITANNVSGATSAAGVLAVSAALLSLLSRTGVVYCG